jgi:hypothetical protein
MRLEWRWSATIVAASTGIVLASCSEPTTSSTPIGRQAGAASANVVGSFGAPAGTLQQTINSGDASVHYCGYQPLVLPILTTFTGADCATTAFNLTSALALYTPGDPKWSVPFTGSSWIGPTGEDAPSNEYRARVGTYEYVTTFNIPAGATNVSLQLQAKSDNALVAYLNGVEIGRNQFLEDCTVEQGAFCNWVAVLNINDSPATFNVGGANVLRIDVVNTRIGFEVGGVGHTARSTCENGPELFGTLGFTDIQVLTADGHQLANWLASLCQNPTGLDFQAKIFFTPAPPPLPIPLFVIGDQEAHGIGATVNFWGAQWWKNNQMSGITSNGYESFKGYASSADNFCGGVWSTQPGNSSDPPATIPANVAIIVTTKVVKNGNTISGDIKQIVIVHQDGNYDDNPGHAGGGTVTQILCTRP